MPGRVNNFLLTAHIGVGEMGEIYRAIDESLFRDVAVKLVRGCHADDPESLERLRLEACAAGRLNHPRVAQVHALNFSNGLPYLVMELVSGEDFAQKLEREGRIGERDALRMALDVAEGLSAINRERLVHGDIKPANIVLDRDGNAKLVDFGLSGMARLDNNGNFVGTPDYIAPELLRGAHDSHSSDLFSFGATLYHLLSGKTPFEGDTAEAVLKARLAKPALPLGKVAPLISVPTQKLVMRMLELHPARRPANSEIVAADIRDALARLTAPVSGAATAPGAAVRPGSRFKLPFPSWSSSRRRAVVTALLGLVAVVELGIAVKQNSFQITFGWLRQEASALKENLARPAPEAVAADPKRPAEAVTPVQKTPDYVRVVTPPAPGSKPRPSAAAKVSEAPADEDSLSWQSVNLGGDKISGSTLRMGDTLIVQGSGTDMWNGEDHCRFAWSKAAGDYTFSAQVKAIADNNRLAVSGLLIKGEDPALGPGVLFGFLGTGELFLQLRQPTATNRAVVVKSSGSPVPLPSYLRIARAGKTFEACTSPDGSAWTPFATCELDLPADNTVGFCVSSQDAAALAAAKFSDIRLQNPGQAANAGDNVQKEAGATAPAAR